MFPMHHRNSTTIILQQFVLLFQFGQNQAIIVTHGFLGSRYDLAHVCERLAADGFVVIAPEFPESISGHYAKPSALAHFGYGVSKVAMVFKNKKACLSVLTLSLFPYMSHAQSAHFGYGVSKVEMVFEDKKHASLYVCLTLSLFPHMSHAQSAHLGYGVSNSRMIYPRSHGWILF